MDLWAIQFTAHKFYSTIKENPVLNLHGNFNNYNKTAEFTTPQKSEINLCTVPCKRQTGLLQMATKLNQCLIISIEDIFMYCTIEMSNVRKYVNSITL